MIQTAQTASAASLLVRTADVETESKTLTGFLSKHLSSDASAARYEWLYRQNPDGPAKVWVACEKETNEIIGVSAAFPKRMRCDEKTVRGYVLGDFCIHPQHRSLGPALTLQKATLEGLSKDGPGLVIDFPSTSMVAIYKRLGIGVSQTMIRFAKPLRANRQIQKRVPNRAMANTLSAAANVALSLRDSQLRRDSGWKILEQTNLCSAEFTAAMENWHLPEGNRGVRSAEYLNWRFLQHPQRHYRLLTARKDKKLGGVLIFEMADEDATVVDMHAESNTVMETLLARTIAITRQCGANTLSAPYLGSPAGQKILQDCGFQPRESTSVVFLTLPWSKNRRDDQAAQHWHLTHGDRES